jgi:hypothetical protein
MEFRPYLATYSHRIANHSNLQDIFGRIQRPKECEMQQNTISTIENKWFYGISGYEEPTGEDSPSMLLISVSC